MSTLQHPGDRADHSTRGRCGCRPTAQCPALSAAAVLLRAARRLLGELVATGRCSAAAAHLDQAIALIEDCAAPALAAPAATPTASPGRLSHREVEVLRLLAAGRSNRAIAAALFLSPRTVQRHVANLYLKIGAHSKAEATAYALRHDLA